MSFKRVINSNSGNFFLKNRRGQVTIFIIIAIFILAAVAAFFIYRNSVPITAQIPLEFQPAYNTFLSCIKDNALLGINILESQGGYISLPEFEPGSSYMPFSSQLNFLGNPIPYWYYVSGNDLEREKVPTQTDMENQLSQFINERIRNCDFSAYTNGDFQIQAGVPAKASISQNKVAVSLDMDLSMNKGNQSVFVKNHNVEVNSELGNLYNSAKIVYDYEQANLFLENYTIDVLRNYAPVDGVEVSCSPLTWNANDIVSNLTSAIENNIDSLRTGNNATDYFSIKIPVEGVRFLTSPSWPNSFEINPAEGNLLIAQPVGSQSGLGVLGFCYIPYHFVYDVKYPVLVTISKNGEIFQFPVAVIIEGNNPRVPLNGTAVSTTTPVLCDNKNTNISVSVFDSDSNPVDADISFCESIGEKCDIGKTSSGSLNALFPQCVGGYVVANADGFAEGRYPFTTTQSGSVNVILDKIYSRQIDLKIDGNAYNGNAVIDFISSGGSKTVVYPQQRSVELSEGYYTVQAYIYENSSIKIGATTKQQCVDVKSGIAGVLGVPQQNCFDINIPAQIISNALSGGGKSDYFIIESQLKNSKTLTINVPSLPKPTSLDQIQQNYLLFESKPLSISFA